MPSNQLFRETVKAMALGDGAKARELNEQIPDADREAYAIYVAAMFAGAAGHQFEADQSPEAIKRFVNEMRHDFRKADPPFQPLAMEGLFRVLFGEEHLLDEISPADQMRLQFLAIRKIVDQSDHMKQRLDDYLTDAETLAEQWMS
ncbi:hypothetical protein [Stackebrandtia nassauensis]|uniref:Uncharacterized protein n=1 Tax=Stackebrandtia nassauensis (strain DSM 44728 / CIP 108903 / NRRL B-16338 / NBRC 102104 / LLR-40K-21) TaxID=446470 RepID=D3Q3Z2_STANL|nr:hypothetical protein [Stackebrandtia nassauensis]ADD44059.1 hypothetical protein Snas_4413 [Stackebrandtia nassauensis DSM 44728]